MKDKKYLLVLDDIWDESRVRWLDLLSLLHCGASGSRVIVTTRSDNVERAVGTTEPHNLGLLAEEESWNLFKNSAFVSEKEENNPNLAQIGKEIVDRCGNVPLAIKVIGSLLHSENSEKHWKRIRDTQHLKAKGMEDNNIMQVLKLSYDYLPPQIKQCFAYCSLFPKDYEYRKDVLVKMWMAQGYIDPSSTDTGEEYFMELAGRNLFQDLRLQEDETGEYCKMHDLVHDMAKKIAGEEIKGLVEPLDQLSFSDGLIHVSVERESPPIHSEWEVPDSLLVHRKMRSLLIFRCQYFGTSITAASSLEMIILKFQSLRVLDLELMDITEVPKSIGKLRHLRYLNLAFNEDIKCLPDDITRLHNLQTLNLAGCSSLIELPRDFCKLDSLRHLEISRSGLSDLPRGLGNMTSLKELDSFIVGRNNGIDSLPPINFTRDMEIIFCERQIDAVVEARKVNLKDYQQLTHLLLGFEPMEMTCDLGEMDKLLVLLKLPPNLKFIKVVDYEGVEMPRKWFDGLSNTLICIEIEGCSNCKVLPHLSRLPHLKTLRLYNLCELEYVEDEDDILTDGGKCGSAAAHNVYFPSLELLQLRELGSLKGLTRPSKGDGGEPRQLLFPRLLELQVDDCLKLMSMPLAPKLESLKAGEINWKVLESNLTGSIDEEEAASPLSKDDDDGEPRARQLLFPCILQLTSHLCPKLIKLKSSLLEAQRINYWKLSKSSNNLTSIDNEEVTSSPSSSNSTTLYTSLQNLIIFAIKDVPASLSISNSLSNLKNLEIKECDELTSLMIESSNSIWHLEIKGCKRLKNISVGNLCVLDTLVLWADSFYSPCDEFEEEIFRSIACLTTLRKLEIEYYNLKQLPEEMGNLSLLRHLEICHCPNMASLPQSLLGLTSLQELYIYGCPMLKVRYNKPNGQDCHHLQHIPDVKFV